MSGVLSGRTILVTRPRERTRAFVDLLRAQGATALEAPTIRLEEAPPGGALDRAIRAAASGRYSWVVFTSPKTVEVWFARDRALRAGGIAAEVAAIGDGTAEALRGNGRQPDLVPGAFTTAALGRAFPRGEGRVLLPRADIAPPDLEEALRAKGWTPVRVTAYRTMVPRSLPADARGALQKSLVDAIVFTSASTVEGFVRLAGVVNGPKVVCIGPVTARAARVAGFRVHAIARPHTVEGLVSALERVVRGRV
ncbi:MAG TPA: uroporphyrinogen-III synthase [Actinomycetota bacterium]|nr:uroporphyrinogen-III synthase [Actinomycetota bacterium]